MSSPIDIDALYRTHGSVVLRRARAILGSEADAHEVLQDVFASLVARPEQFGGRSSPATFLYRATTHCCLNRLRDTRNRRRLLVAHAGGATAGPEAGPETRSVVTDLLRTLPEEIAQVLIYHHVDEMSHEEIAEMLGCSRRRVGRLLERVGRHTADAEEARP